MKSEASLPVLSIWKVADHGWNAGIWITQRLMLLLKEQRDWHRSLVENKLLLFPFWSFFFFLFFANYTLVKEKLLLKSYIVSEDAWECHESHTDPKNHILWWLKASDVMMLKKKINKKCFWMHVKFLQIPKYMLLNAIGILVYSKKSCLRGTFSLWNHNAKQMCFKYRLSERLCRLDALKKNRVDMLD